MNQQIIIGGKRTGKTTKIIQLSAENGRYILVKDKNEADNLAKLAIKLGLNIPYPVTIQEVGNGKLEGSIIRRDGLYVDNALDLLEQIIAVPIAGASINYEVSE
ncbi:replicase [Listeria monocytogenes]|nr:replicase [Listeria monocytogenes]